MSKKPPQYQDSGGNYKRKKLVQTKLDVHFYNDPLPRALNSRKVGNSKEEEPLEKETKRETLAGAALIRATTSEKECEIDCVDLTEEQSTSNADTPVQRHFWEEGDSESSRSASTTASVCPESPDDTVERMEVSFLGATITSLRRSALRLPKLQASAERHTILFDTTTLANVDNGVPPKPYPRRFWDKWDGDHVRMPCSSHSEYPVSETELVPRWTLVQEALTAPMKTFDDLKRSILSYNNRYATKWNFSGLKQYIESVMEEAERDALFSTTLSKMAELALQLPEVVTHPIPLLKRGMSHTMTMTQQQAACLLANAFFCTFPRRNQQRNGSEYADYPDINFQGLFGSGKVLKAKLDFIFHYFRRITGKMPEGSLSFTRVSLDAFPDWSSSTCRLTQLHISQRGTIEDFGEGMLQVDFANKFLGGGVLRHGSVQEEIRFLGCPEMIVSMLFTESLATNECLIMTGCERFSYYTGYGSSLQWLKSFEDTTPRDEWGRRRVEVVAMDAIPFSRFDEQFKKEAIDRELNKAYCGFSRRGLSTEYLTPVATGNWGCGAFGGDKELKSLIQILAAAEAGRDVVYFTFDDGALMRKIYETYELLVKNRNNIGQIYDLLMQYCSCMASSSDKPISLFQFIQQHC